MKRIVAVLLIMLLFVPSAIAADGRMVIANCREYVTLRAESSTGAAAIVRMPLGEQVTVLGRASGGFVRVQYFGYTGYVLEKYLAPWTEPAYTPRTQTVSGHPIYCGNYGTAKRIEGRTVVVAIFANDKTTAWDFSRDADQNLRLRNRLNLSIACTWLTEQVRRWRASPGGFVWDWREHGDLYYTHAFSVDIVHGQGDADVSAAINRYIDSCIPTQKLLDEYGADNIIYNIYLNAPNSENYRSWCRAVLFNEVAADKYAPEVCVIVPYGRGRENTPAVLAHEMLHCFGAYDLYETYAGSPITQKYVDYLMSHGPNDLMNHCYFSDYDIITTEFSDVDAYYVGLVRTCADVQKWGLGMSIFDRYQEN